jgi:hypothetical protein
MNRNHISILVPLTIILVMFALSDSGDTPYQKEIELSVRELVPIVAKFEQWNVVRDRINRMIDKHFLN